MSTIARIAAFDLDGTLLRGQSGTLVLQYLLKRHLIPLKVGALASWWGVRYKLHLPYRQEEVREEIIGAMCELPVKKIVEIMHEFHDEVLVGRYFDDGKSELKRHREAGEHVVIISATFDAIAQASREYLGVEAALATIMERTQDGEHYTGRVAGRVTAGAEKLARVRAYANTKFGDGKWELAWAFGDHYTDAPLLEAASNCACVNPTHTLKQEAIRRGWSQVQWR